MKLLYTLLFAFFISCSTEPELKDCAGIENGSAAIDDCGLCTGGTTGQTACVQDCAGAWGGSAAFGNYYLDADGDTFGYGSANVYCSAFVPSGWVANNSDVEPDCATNDTDACGVCNGVVPTWYRDADADGFGDSGNTTPSCTLPSGYTNDNSDIDDSCYCLTNTDAAYTNGGLCKDDTGKCGGDGYTANCTDIDYIIGNYSSTMTCVDMDCDGQATTSNGGSGTDVFGYYWDDNDGDGLGGMGSDRTSGCGGVGLG